MITFLTVDINIVAGVGTCAVEMEHYEQGVFYGFYFHHQQQCNNVWFLL
jgi:hypothetical protein